MFFLLDQHFKLTSVLSIASLYARSAVEDVPFPSLLRYEDGYPYSCLISDEISERCYPICSEVSSLILFLYHTRAKAHAIAEGKSYLDSAIISDDILMCIAFNLSLPQ